MANRQSAGVSTPNLAIKKIKNTAWRALEKIYQIDVPAHLSKRNMSAIFAERFEVGVVLQNVQDISGSGVQRGLQKLPYMYKTLGM